MKEEKVNIAEEARLSESRLWELQRAAYGKFGVDAWRKKGVPFYLTGNPHTAKQYAQMTVGYIQDGLSKDAKTPIDLNEPLYIFDLGSGSGRFAFLYLKKLLIQLEQLQLQQLKISYVITDIVRENLDFCYQHPQMQSHVKSGRLDFAFYDHLQIAPLELNSGKKLTCLINPAAVIANYFFDTIPQDLFKVIDGKLYEGRIALSVPKDAVHGNIDEIDPLWIQQLDYSYSYKPCDPKNYYPNSLMNTILEEYCREFDGCSFLFPIGAFRTIDYYKNLTHSRLLLLAADQGVCTEKQIRKWGNPEVTRHASFSMAVSYHAIARYFDLIHGEALLTSQSDPLFVVTAALLGGKATDYPKTFHAFKTIVDAFEPSDYWKLSGLADVDDKKLTLDTLIALLKLGGWDPINFNSIYPQIRNRLADANASQKERLIAAIEKTSEQFYIVGPEENAFIINLGVLLFEIGAYEKALQFFNQALAFSGETPLIAQNIAACKNKLQKQLNSY